jgi:hypothetical protein
MEKGLFEQMFISNCIDDDAAIDVSVVSSLAGSTSILPFTLIPNSIKDSKKKKNSFLLKCLILLRRLG